MARFFELRLLAALGYRPQLFACAQCARPLEPAGNAFGPAAGGVLCPACRQAHRDALPLDERTFRVLRYLQSRPWAEVRAVAIGAATHSALERVMHAYLRHLAERELRSAEFLQAVRRTAPPPVDAPAPGIAERPSVVA